MPRRNENSGRRPRGPRPVPNRWKASSGATGSLHGVHDESRPTDGALPFAAVDPKLATHKRNGESAPMAADDETQVRPQARRPRIWVPAPDLDWRPAA